MANRRDCCLLVDPIIIDCGCGAQYVLYLVEERTDQVPILQECGPESFCPFCGRDYRQDRERMMSYLLNQKTEPEG